MNKIIASISTPLGRGAISIIRMSGEGCQNVAKKVFSSSLLDWNNITPNRLYLGFFQFDDGLKERCFQVYFKSPHSYTGEDMIEYQVHGGVLLTQKVLSTLLENGATLASPGEFSKRAFENGKISLDEAESIIGEINAESEGELKASLMSASGALKDKVMLLQENLTAQIAEIEATLDYPEEDFEKSAKEKIFSSVQNVKNEIDDLVKQAQNARFINKGINIAIVGAPNVGKSSLLNEFVGQEKAIVTDIAGTTRDIVSEQIFYKGLKFNFVDTAGIRDAIDKVEKIGVEKSKEAISSADIVLFVLDGSEVLSKEDEKIFNIIKSLPHIVIINKSDKTRKMKTFEDEIVVSAVEKKGIEEVKEKVYQKVIKEEIDFSKTVVINERQVAILGECGQIANDIMQAKEESMDIIAMLIKKLWNSLGKITGQCENEKIIDLIFSKFCLGK